MLAGVASDARQQGCALQVQPDQQVCRVVCRSQLDNLSGKQIEDAAVLRLAQAKTDIAGLHTQPQLLARGNGLMSDADAELAVW